MVNAWSSGTGMAGVLGSILYISFGCIVGAGGDNQTHLRKLIQYAFLLTSPAVGLYLVAYFFIIKAPDTQKPRDTGDDSENEPMLSDRITGTSHSNIQGDDLYPSGTTQSYDTKESTFSRWVRCTKLVSWMSFNLCAVYLFEYVAQGCASKVRPGSEYHKGCPELYAGLSLCYQAGVFVSRSSVQLVHIKRVEILSILQFINMLLWVIDVHYKFLPVAILPTLMVYVGLLGGASYVNIFYNLLNDSKYPDKDRELCINITALFITVGIISGTVLETILFNTVLKSD